jgi:hypothetical protein
MINNALNFRFKINIPKIIWQTGKDEYSKLKYPFNINVKTWQEINPEWEYIYADQNKKYQDIIEYGDKDFIELSNYLDGPFLADLWRYIMIYQYGGVYADLDSVNVIPLEILPYNITNYNCQAIISNGSGYSNYLNLPMYKFNYEMITCPGCLKFSELTNSSVFSQKTWLENCGFAAVKNSKPLLYVLDEVKRRFALFKELHHNGFDNSHEMLKVIVDCSAFEIGITKDESIISRTFVYDVQSHGEKSYEGLKLFKDFFTDIACYNFNKIFFYKDDNE